MPEWPAEGVADADWVEQALEWRLSKGVDDCGQEMLALDALSLEWVANSTEIQVNIETQNWPFLAVSPELMAPPAPGPPTPPLPVASPFPPEPPVAWLSVKILCSTVRVALNWTIAPP